MTRQIATRIQHHQSEALPFEAAGHATDNDQIEILGRVAVLQNTAGFMPTSRQEANQATALLDERYVGLRWGAAKQAAEVLTRQRKIDAEDPDAAVRSITHDYIGFRRKALADKTALVTLQTEVRYKVASPAAMLEPARLYTGSGQLARYRDLASLVETRDPEKFPFSPLQGYEKGRAAGYDPYTVPQPQPIVANRIAAVVSALRYREAPATVAAAVADQSNRIAFWTDRLHEMTFSTIARPLVEAALGSEV